MDVPKRLLAEQLRTGGILINPQQTLQDGVTGDERLLWGDDHVQDGRRQSGSADRTDRVKLCPAPQARTRRTAPNQIMAINLEAKSYHIAIMIADSP